MGRGPKAGHAEGPRVGHGLGPGAGPRLGCCAGLVVRPKLRSRGMAENTAWASARCRLGLAGAFPYT
eukprot:5022918-Lingulodinium_polyedra.AAC.1